MIPAQQVRRPLVGAALSVAAGLAVQQAGSLSPLIGLSLAAGLLALLCLRRSTPALYLTCALLAAVYGSLDQADPRRTALLQAEVFSERQIVTGTLTDDPSADAGRSSFRMRTDAVLLDGNWVPDRTLLRIYLNNPQEPAAYGERWQIEGRFSAYPQSRSGTDGSLSASGASAQRIRPAELSLTGLCYQLRSRAAAVLSRGIETFPDTEKLLHALLLGYRQALPQDLHRTFSRTGTLHIFAISGLHVGVTASILIAALKIAGVCRLRWGWILIPSLFAYVLATGMKPSALRAFTMASVYFAAPLVGRRPDAPSAIALAALILLLHHPASIREPGALLSFTVVCGLILVHGWTGRQPFGLRPAGWGAALNRLKGPHPAAAVLRGTGLLMLTSLTAWVFSAPITARFFHTLAPAALIGNLAVIPLTFMIVLTACLSLPGGVLFPPASVLFNQANLLFIGLLIRVIDWLARLPGACLTVYAPSAPATALWYTGLVVLFTGPVRWRKAALLTVLSAGLLWTAEQKVQLQRSAKAAEPPWINKNKEFFSPRRKGAEGEGRRAVRECRAHGAWGMEGET